MGTALRENYNILLVRNLQTIGVGSDAIFSSMQDALKGGLQEALVLSFSCQEAG